MALTPLLLAHHIEIDFPDEPSPLRPKGTKFSEKGALKNLLASAERKLLSSPAPITLIGLSFGAVIAEHLVQKFPERIQKLILISPTPHLQSVFLKMIQIARDDFEKENSPLASELKRHQVLIQSFYDLPTQLSLSYTMRDPNFFGHYWFNSTAMAAWGKTLADREYAFDTVSQKSVYEDLRDRPELLLKAKNLAVPVSLIFGSHDPVLNPVEVCRYYKEKFTSVEEIFYADSAHFPHLEESAKFLQFLAANMNSK